MNNKFSLGILQTHATQFDGPLFRSLANSGKLDLSIYYYRSEEDGNAFDPELERKVVWNNSVHSGYRADISKKGILEGLRQIRRIINAQHDLLIVSGYANTMSIGTALAALVSRTPVGLRLDSVLIYDTGRTWKHRIKELILPLLFKYIYTTGHATGSLTKEYLEHFSFKKEAVFLYPYNVDNAYLREIFVRSKERQEELKRSFGIGNEDDVILGVVKLVPREDPVTLLLGYAAVAKKYPSCHLILVGDGELKQELMRLTRAHELTNIHYPGYIPYNLLPLYYGIADIFVHPARVEQWGVSVNEAMVCEATVVAADTVGAVRDLIIHEQTGLIFRCGDSADLGRCLIKLLDAPKMRRFIANNALNMIDNWTFAQTEDQIIQALKYVTESSRTVNEV